MNLASYLPYYFLANRRHRIVSLSHTLRRLRPGRNFYSETLFFSWYKLPEQKPSRSTVTRLNPSFRN